LFFRFCRKPLIGKAIRKAIRRAQHLRQVAQPAGLIELFVLFDDCAEEFGLSGQTFFESPDNDHDEYFTSIRQVGVDFGAGGQILPCFIRGDNLLAAFGQLPDHARLRAGDLLKPTCKGAAGQFRIQGGSRHLSYQRQCLLLERIYLRDAGHPDAQHIRDRK
jgi:hypothetical protein